VHMSHEGQDDWDEYNSAVMYAYNCRVHSSLGIPPIELVVSRPSVTISLEKKPRDEEVAPLPAKREVLERLRTLRERAGGNLHRAQHDTSEVMTGFSRRSIVE
jgi:hypothetical protein